MHMSTPSHSLGLREAIRRTSARPAGSRSWCTDCSSSRRSLDLRTRIRLLGRCSMRFANSLRRKHSVVAASLALLCAAPLCVAVGASRGAGATRAESKLAVGYVTAVMRQSVAVGKRRLEPEGVPYGDDRVFPLHAGDRLRATSHGRVWFDVRRGNKGAYCSMRPRRGLSSVRVAPSASVLLNFDAGRLQCSTTRSGGKKTIRVGPVTVETVDPVVGIVVEKRRVVVRIRRGSAVVTGRTGKGVVVGFNGSATPRYAQQVVVPRGGAARPATTVRLNSEDRMAFTRLGSRLPPARIPLAPPATKLLQRPPNPSNADVTFAFKSAAARIVFFSCALDSGPFRVCSSPYRYSGLKAGAHTFLVKATDGAGFTGPPSSYSWTVIRSAPPGIAFASNRAGEFDVFVIHPDGSGLTRLTTAKALDDDPEWSLDGARIVFHSERDRNSEIYVMNADGSKQIRLTVNPATDRNPTWSPDGTKIAFESYRDDAKTREIYVMNADGSGQTRLTANSVQDFDPAWSPDGARIAFASERDGNREIYVMNADGSKQTRLTTTAAAEFNPEWSPSGRRLAFHSDRDGNYEIYAMNTDGTGQTRLTASAGHDFNPTWSPDGRQIAFQSNRDGNWEIYVMDNDGRRQRNLTNNVAVDQVPDW
jgi:WD40-like Beta Propeller Repeat